MPVRHPAWRCIMDVLYRAVRAAVLVPHVDGPSTATSTGGRSALDASVAAGHRVRLDVRMPGNRLPCRASRLTSTELVPAVGDAIVAVAVTLGIAKVLHRSVRAAVLVSHVDGLRAEAGTRRRSTFDAPVVGWPWMGLDVRMPGNRLPLGTSWCALAVPVPVALAASHAGTITSGHASRRSAFRAASRGGRGLPCRSGCRSRRP